MISEPSISVAWTASMHVHASIIRYSGSGRCSHVYFRGTRCAFGAVKTNNIYWHRTCGVNTLWSIPVRLVEYAAIEPRSVFALGPSFLSYSLLNGEFVYFCFMTSARNYLAIGPVFSGLSHPPGVQSPLAEQPCATADNQSSVYLHQSINSNYESGSQEMRPCRLDPTKTEDASQAADVCWGPRNKFSQLG